MEGEAGAEMEWEVVAEMDWEAGAYEGAHFSRPYISRFHELRLMYGTWDKIDYKVLDFDFERFCCITLSNRNVYGCLVCGRCYHGREPGSPAYTHTLRGHHVFVCLQTAIFYLLPEDIEVFRPLWACVRKSLNPRYSRERLDLLDNPNHVCRALNTDINRSARNLEHFYLPPKPGCWMRPLDITGNEFVSVTIQCLMRVIPLRNFFLLPENYQHCKSPLIHQFGELTQRYWSAWNCRKELRPYAFLDAVKQASNNRYQIGVESDPVQFMAWLLNSLHAGLRTPNNNDSIIHRCFQGELEVMKEIPSQGSIGDGQNKSTTNDEADLAAITVETCRMPFLMLGLDLPMDLSMRPFFEDNRTQVPLSNLLKKFDGEFVTEVVWPQRQKMRYRIIRLPRYLILHMNRFTKNNFFAEKNRTLIEFPIKELDLEDYVPLPIAEQVFSRYDFVAHVIHHGRPGDSGHDEARGDGLYNLYVHHKSSSSWEEKLGQEDKGQKETHMRLNFVNDRVVALSESSIQIYEQQD